DIRAIAASERIARRLDEEKVVPVPAVNGVAVSAGNSELIVPRIAVECVAKRGRRQLVVAIATVQEIANRVDHENIVATLRVGGITPGKADLDRAVARTTVQNVVGREDPQQIVSIPSIQSACPKGTAQTVVPGVSVERV